MTLHIGMLLFPKLTQLDLTGPFEVLVRVPDAQVHLLWKTLDPVVADSGIKILPSAKLSDSPPLDVVFVPGGGGVTPLLDDEDVLAFLRTQGERARYVTSVCTGSLLLGAAGLLRGTKRRRTGRIWTCFPWSAPARSSGESWSIATASRAAG